MKGLKALLWVGGIGIIAYAVYRYYQKQVEFLKNIEYKILGVSIVSINNGVVTIDITARIFNTSNVEATIKEMYLDFYLNNSLVGNVNEVKDILILPNQSSDVSARFSFDAKKVLGNVITMATFTIAGNAITYNLKGYVKLKTSFITATLPFQYENSFSGIFKKK